MKDILKEQLNRIKLDKDTYLKVVLDSNPDTLDMIASKIIEGGDIIELSGRSISSAEFLDMAQKVKLLCAQFDKTLIIEERTDIAYLVEADGVFLAKNDIDISSARKLLGANALIGVESLQDKDADYMLLEQSLTNTEKLPCFIKTKMEKIFVYYTHLKNISATEQ